MSGLELQHEIIERKIDLPLIFITGHADIEIAVETIKRGADDFLIKPVKEEKLFSSISKALLKYQNLYRNSDIKNRVQLLSERERSVLLLTLQGVETKQVAEYLGIGERTVQGHRWRIYQKLNINNVEELKKQINPEWLKIEMKVK